MSKSEIMAELTRLSPEDLAEVRDWLEHFTLSKTAAGANGAGIARIRSPRLANPRQSADFIKHITELPADAAL